MAGEMGGVADMQVCFGVNKDKHRIATISVELTLHIAPLISSLFLKNASYDI